LEIRQKAAGFPHFHRAGGGFSLKQQEKKDAAETEFHLTIPVTSSTMISPASLRSDHDRHRIGTSDRDQIGITDHLHRNQQIDVQLQFIDLILN